MPTWFKVAAVIVGLLFFVPLIAMVAIQVLIFLNA